MLANFVSVSNPSTWDTCISWIFIFLDRVLLLGLFHISELGKYHHFRTVNRSGIGLGFLLGASASSFSFSASLGKEASRP